MGAWGKGIVSAALVWLVACGGGTDPAPEGPGTTPDAQEASEASESPSPGFLAFDYKPVDLKTCDNTFRLGTARRVTLEAPETVGTTIFRPGCITDVAVGKVEITLKNTSTNLHNVIVEGNDHELVTGAGETGSATFMLASGDDQIGFQCTIHDRMYGAFFR